MIKVYVMRYKSHCHVFTGSSKKVYIYVPGIQKSYSKQYYKS